MVLPSNALASARLSRLKIATSCENTGKNKVLVVEDSKSIRELLCAYINNLHAIGADSAASLGETKTLLANRAREYFISVVDLNLPDAEQGEIVDLVQSHGIPVIVMTGTVDEKVREAMLRKNVLDYVIKQQATEIEHIAYIVGRMYENRQLKVLVVDDSPSFRHYLAALLENYQYQVLQADNGLEALEILRAHPDIALILTDYNMPRMNGQELIQAVRKDHRREDLAIIGLSDASKTGVSVLMLKCGANDFLSKPFEVEEFYCRVTQNTNMIGYVRRIKEHATRDFLTGLYNRRHLFEVGTHLYNNAKRGNCRIAIGLVDADHFKRINDTHGHDTGDLVLQQIARTLKQTLRGSDVIARFGGEEFVCLIVIKHDEDHLAAFERVRKAVADTRIQAGDETIRITTSIGVSSDLGESLEDMIRLADKAVYRAKKNGRNRVEVANRLDKNSISQLHAD